MSGDADVAGDPAPSAPAGPLMFARSVHVEAPVFSYTSPLVWFRYQSPTAPVAPAGAPAPENQTSAIPGVPAEPVFPCGPLMLARSVQADAPVFSYTSPVAVSRYQSPTAPVPPAGAPDPECQTSATPGVPGFPCGPCDPVEPVAPCGPLMLARRVQAEAPVFS